MSGCTNTGRPGCRGRLCRSAHSSLRQLPVVRYPAGDDGRPDLTAQPVEGWVCGLLSYKPASKNGFLDIPGVSGGQRPMYIIAAAGSLEPPLAAGDRITADGRTMAACAVSEADCLTADLIPAEEAK